MKKFRYIALALMLLQLTACGGEITPSKTDDTSPSDTSSEETTPKYLDNLPETDLDGFEFRIFIFS